MVKLNKTIIKLIKLMEVKMKIHKVFLILLLAMGGIALGMEQAINENAWKRVSILLNNANDNELEGYVKILVNSKTDLNKGANKASLLQELLVNAVRDIDYLTPQKGCSNVRFGLKELIKHDKLDVNLVMDGKPLATLLDNTRPNLDKRNSKFLTTLYAEIY